VRICSFFSLVRFLLTSFVEWNVTCEEENGNSWERSAMIGLSLLFRTTSEQEIQ